ncbi:uncharacterized protein LOC143246196 isoform X2 [Tachypleus tridentatus]|uniref:uncharacterized protein LOC143246196 isoform X2 n=1 Tax=Tachypleus tridentatus TaxID=6853 RepID=UPI003FD1D7A6
MWSLASVHSSNKDDSDAPCVRSKHAVCLTEEGLFYLLGGVSGSLPLKDLWKYDPVQNQWKEIHCSEYGPPFLQDHTIVSWKDKLCVFGGELSFATTEETPLWILSTESNSWKKMHSKTAAFSQPSGRRGHTALKYNESERWHFFKFPNFLECPLPRHNHTSVIHDEAMWVYGGMTDLQERGDFWKFDFSTLNWSRIKTNKGPGELHNHSAVKFLEHMYIFGGEHDATIFNYLWRYHFGNQIWEKVIVKGLIPNPVTHHVALVNPIQFAWEEKYHAWEHPRTFEVINQYSVSGKSSTHKNEPHTQNLSELAQSNHLKTSENRKSRQYFKFRVYPVYRPHRKSSVPEKNKKNKQSVAVVYNASTDHVQLRSLRGGLKSGSLLKHLRNSSHNVLCNPYVPEQQEELIYLVEETCSLQESLLSSPNLLVQKSCSSEAVLVSDGKLPTFQNKNNNDVFPGDCEPLVKNEPFEISDLPHLSQQFKVSKAADQFSWTSNEKVGNEDVNHISDSGINSVTPVENCSKDYASAFYSPKSVLYEHEYLSTMDMDDKKTYESIKDVKLDSCSNQRRTSAGVLLIDLENINLHQSKISKINEQRSNFSPVLENYSQACRPVGDKFDMSNSVSRNLQHHSTTKDDLHQDFASVLNPETCENILYKKQDNPVEMKLLNPPHELSLGNLCRGNITRSEKREGIEQVLEKSQETVHAAAMETTTVMPSDLQINALPNCEVTQEKLVNVSNSELSKSISKNKEQHHQKKLCMYVFGGRELGISSFSRRPISVWKLYI